MSELNQLSKLKSLTYGTGIAQKTNNPYTYLDLIFENDYKVRVFLNQDQKFILTPILSTKTSIPVTSDEAFVDFLSE